MAGAIVCEASETGVKPARVLLLFEDRNHGELRSLLVQEGCDIDEESLYADAAGTPAGGYALVLFQVKSPSGGLLEILRSWRDGQPDTPLVVIGHRTPQATRVAILEAGAAAYLARPVSVPELTARLRAAFRRSRGQEPRTLEGTAVHLTPTELSILRHLSLHRNRTVPFHELVRALWGNDPQKGVHSLRRFIRRLRQKLEPNPTAPQYLLTDPKIGYRLQVQQGVAPSTIGSDYLTHL